jgi:hypothetical protein
MTTGTVKDRLPLIRISPLVFLFNFNKEYFWLWPTKPLINCWELITR